MKSTFTPAITGVVGLYPLKQLQEKYKIQASGVRELGIHTPHPPPKSQWLRPSQGVRSPRLVSYKVHGQSNLHSSEHCPQAQRCRCW